MSGIAAPLGSRLKLGVAWIAFASSGYPDGRRRPIMFSCSVIATRSQNSVSIRISRTTK